MAATNATRYCHPRPWCERAAALLCLAAMAATVIATGGCRKAGSDASQPSAADIEKLRAEADSQTSPSDSPPANPLVFPTTLQRELTVKETAVDALGRIGEPAVPALIEALRDRDADVRESAARAFARMGDAGKAAIPTLIERLGDADEAVRKAAARALGQMGPDAAAAVPALISIIRSPDSQAGQARP